MNDNFIKELANLSNNAVKGKLILDRGTGRSTEQLKSIKEESTYLVHSRSYVPVFEELAVSHCRVNVQIVALTPKELNTFKGFDDLSKFLYQGKDEKPIVIDHYLQELLLKEAIDSTVRKVKEIEETTMVMRAS